HVEGAGPHQGVGDLEGLLAVVGLRDEQVLGLDAELAAVADVERVLGMEEGAGAATFLRLGHQVQGQGGLARRFGAVDLDDPAARHTADAERQIEAERPRGQRGNVVIREVAGLPELHDRALAELLLDLADGEIDGPLAIHVDSHVTPSSAPGARPKMMPYSTPPALVAPAARDAFLAVRSGHSRELG